MNLDRICCIVGCCINRIHCHNYDKGKAGTYWGVEMIITDFSHNIYSVLLQILDFQNTQAHAGKYIRNIHIGKLPYQYQLSPGTVDL